MVHNVPSIVHRIYVANQSSHNTTRLNITTANVCVIHVLSSQRSLLRLPYIINHSLFLSYQSILIIYMRRTCYSSISEFLLTLVLYAELIALSIINKAMEWIVKQSMIRNSRICNLHKAIDWIEKQSLGLRPEAIAWINGQSIGSNCLDFQAIDWIVIAWLMTKRMEASHLHWNMQWRAECLTTDILHSFSILMLKTKKEWNEYKIVHILPVTACFSEGDEHPSAWSLTKRLLSNRLLGSPSDCF